MGLKQSEADKAQTREEYKKQKQAENHLAVHSGTKRIRVRLIPIWLRIVLLIVVVAVSLTAGALVGYGAIGGGKATDVFKLSTWTHIRDLVEKEK